MELESYLFVLKRLSDHGYSAYFVGGCVRDFFLNRKITDIDIATSAPQKLVEELFNNHDIDLSAKYFGVITLNTPVTCQITTFRMESDYHNHRYPHKIKFVDDVSLDALRRDFTVNALYLDKDLNPYDPFTGIKDLENKILRCVGNPALRLNEDALRILRAIRFSVTLEFSIEAELLKACIDLASTLSYLKRDTIELERIKLFDNIINQNQLDKLEYYKSIIPSLNKYF